MNMFMYMLRCDSPCDTRYKHIKELLTVKLNPIDYILGVTFTNCDPICENPHNRAYYNAL